MKTYEFPYGGSFGPGDSWDGTNEVELTDEEAERLEASARKEPRWHLDEDPEIADIYEKVYAYLYEQDIQTILHDKFRMEELRDDYLYDHEDGLDDEGNPITDRKLVEMEMDRTSFHVCYPEELQDLDEYEDDDEE